MNFSPQNSTVKNGYFLQLNNMNVYVVTAISFSLLSLLSNPPLLYAMIRYEQFGSDKKRTLVNKLVSSTFWCGILYLLLVQGLYTLRFILGPLPQEVCLVVYFVKRIISTQVLICLDAIILTRYVFIFWLQNPAAFNDDFWHLFIIIWAGCFSVSFNIIRVMIPGRHMFEYCMCTGENPTSKMNLAPVLRGYSEVLSIILHVFCYIKIAIYKRKHSVAVGPESRGVQAKRIQILELEATSLNSFATNLIFVLILIFGIVLVSIWPSPKSLKNIMFPYNLKFYFDYLLFPGFGFTFLILRYFTKNLRLRQSVARDLKESLKNLCPF